MPTSMTTAPSLTQSPLIRCGDADRGDQDVGAAADLGEVARARVRGGDGRVGLQQQRGDRLADEVGAADDDGLGAGQVDVVALEQLHAAERRAGPQAREVLGQQAGRDRRQAVDVLARGDLGRQLRAVDVLRRRQLEQDAADRRVGVELRAGARGPRPRGVSAGEAVVEAA